MTLINTFYIDTYKLRHLRDINKGPFTALFYLWIPNINIWLILPRESIFNFYKAQPL
jgi:hypothetical protein